MADVCNRKLRRLASRLRRIAKRRAGESAALAADAGTAEATSVALIKAYDTAVNYESTFRREMAEGKGAVANFVKMGRQWLPFLVRDIPGFDGIGYFDNPGVPDIVLSDADVLLDTIAKATAKNGEPLPYAETMTKELLSALASRRRNGTRQRPRIRNTRSCSKRSAPARTPSIWG